MSHKYKENKVFFFISILFFGVIFSCSKTSTSSDKFLSNSKLFCISDSVLIRNFPSQKSIVLGKLNAGETVEKIETSINTSRIILNGRSYTAPWIKIRTHNNREGWVYGKLLFQRYFTVPKPITINFAFKPIGWSKEGFFAYVFSYNPGCAVPSEVHLSIINSNNNHRIIGVKENMEVHTFWEKNIIIIHDALNQNAIESSQPKLKQFPLIKNKTIINFKIKKKPTEHPYLSNYELFIVENDIENKIFFRNGVIVGDIIGYIENPFNNNNIIILISESNLCGSKELYLFGYNLNKK